MFSRLCNRFGKFRVLGTFGAVFLIAIMTLLTRGEPTTMPSIEGVRKQEVTLRSLDELRSVSTFSVVGTVRSLSEASLQTEASGRVTKVYVNIGDHVSVGTILASLENSRERAVLLQAEGAYESAQAGSEGNTVSLDEAAVSVKNTYRNSLTIVQGVVLSTIDDYFSNPDGVIVGFRLSGGNGREMSAERKGVEAMLKAWQETISRDFEGKNEDELLTEAEKNTKMVNDFVVHIAEIQNEETQLSSFYGETYRAELLSARSSLDATLATISRTRQSYEQARLLGAKDTPSQSSAQLKSALGTLRNAQVSYEKTLVRSPISGVVNAFYLKEGTYAGMNQPAALIANNGSLEISTALGEQDLGTIAVGDSVMLDNHATGTINHIAPAVDPLSGKVEVKISVENESALKNGSTVRVTFSRNTLLLEKEGKLVVPLTALKLLPSGPITFGVSDVGALIAYPVIIGDVLGETVEIKSGLSGEQKIVVDARGLKEGDQVTISE